MNNNKKAPMVSVIMPCYNHEKYVGYAIESVLNQTYKDFEFIVVENGSTDGSYEVIKKYDDKIDKIIHFDVNNLARAGSTMIGESRGKYLAFMTSDDIWEKEKLELQMQVFERNPQVKACFTGANIIDESEGRVSVLENDMFNGSTVNRSRYEWLESLLLKGNCLAYPSTVIEKAVYLELDQGQRVYYQLGDLNLWIRLLLKYDIHVIEKPLISFRWHRDDKNPNMSAPSLDSVVRHDLEYTMILEEIIGNMDNETFINVFGKYFIFPTATTDEDIACEKLFVFFGLAKSNASAWQLPVNYFYKMSTGGNNRFLKKLEQDYGYTLLDFQKYCAENGPLRYQFIKKQVEGLQSLLEERKLYTKILLEALDMEGDKEQRKLYYKKKFFSEMPERERELLTLAIKCLENIFSRIEEKEAKEFSEQFDEMIEIVHSIWDNLEGVWESFLCMDTDIGEARWHDWKNIFQKRFVAEEEFCDETLPALISLYKVLLQYAG